MGKRFDRRHAAGVLELGESVRKRVRVSRSDARRRANRVGRQEDRLHEFDFQGDAVGQIHDATVDPRIATAVSQFIRQQDDQGFGHALRDIGLRVDGDGLRRRGIPGAASTEDRAEFVPGGHAVDRVPY